MPGLASPALAPHLRGREREWTVRNQMWSAQATPEARLLAGTAAKNGHQIMGPWAWSMPSLPSSTSWALPAQVHGVLDGI